MKRFIFISRTLLFLASFLTLSSLHAQTATDWINGALDTNNLVFDNFGMGFSLDDETGSVGGTSVVSNPTNHGRSAGFSFEIEGPLSGSFRWKVSSERAYDELVFRVDGQQKAAISGNRSWDTVSFTINAGVHKLEWIYDKDGSQSVGFDRGWVDQLTIDPHLLIHGGSPLDHEVGTTYVDQGATYYDAANASVAVSVSSGIVNASALGTYNLTYSHNGMTATRTVVVKDTTPPVITLQGDAIQNVLMGAPSYTDPGATATDAYEGSVTVSKSGGVDTTKAGDYILTYNATDTSGNTADPVTRTVRVLDTFRPVITLNGSATMTHEAATAFEDPGATAIDNGVYPIDVTVTGTVEINQLGSYTLTYTSVDESGNQAVPKTRTVTVVDTEGPVITLNAVGATDPTTTDPTEEEQAAVAPTDDASVIDAQLGQDFEDPGATAVDALDGAVLITTSGAVDTTIAGPYYLTYRAQDSSGNVTTVIRTVNVADTQPPVIELIGSSVVNHEVGTDYVDQGAEIKGEDWPINVDNQVDGNVIGTYTVTYDATDNYLNEATTVVRTVNVRDTTPPTVALEGRAEVSHPVGTEYTDERATATDVGDPRPSVTSSGIVNTAVLGDYFITYTATDASGNQSDPIARKVSVVDITPPALTAVVANKVTKKWSFDSSNGDEFPYVTSTQGPSVVMGSWATDGLVAHYTFDGDATDATGKGNDGIITGATLSSDRFNKANSALLMNGDNQFVEIFPQDDGLDQLDGDTHTVSFWIKPSSVSETPASIVRRERDNTFFWIQNWWGAANETSKGYVTHIANTGYSVLTSMESSTQTSEVGQWTAVTFVSDSNGSTIYFNGQQVGQGDSVVWPSLTGSSLVLGHKASYVDHNGTYQGLLDDVRIYSRSLSAEEVNNLYVHEKGNYVLGGRETAGLVSGNPVATSP